jgi:hypothetical protein
VTEEGGDEVIVGEHDVSLVLITVDTTSAAPTSTATGPVITTVRSVNRGHL